MLARLTWDWREVNAAPSAQAAVACGRAARQLLERLARLPVDPPSRLLATANGEMLVVIGPEEALPWVPGVAYAAPCPEAPTLWLPTLWRPTVPCDLLEQALLRRHGREPLLLWRDPPAIVPLDRQLPVTPALIERIAGLWRPQ